MRTPAIRIALVLFCLLLLPAAAFSQRSSQCSNPPPQAQCPSGPKDPCVPYCSYYDRFPYGFAYNKNDLNADLNDYGSLFEDMGRGTDCCPETVQRMLTQKVSDEVAAGAFGQRWLGGGDMLLTLATALQLGHEGALPANLHTLLLTALDQYIAANTPLPIKNCSRPQPPDFDRSNTCMEDYAVAAAALGWAAAYYQQNGMPTQAQSAGNFAEQYIRDSFNLTDAICLHRVGTPCNVCETMVVSDDLLYEDIRNDRVEVLTFNRSQDNPNYGLGLLTLLSTAVEGLHAANRNYEPTRREAILAQGLVRHGQKRVSAPGGDVCQDWGSECYVYGASCLVRTDCRDLNYKPGMYPVKGFLVDVYSLDGGLPLVLASTPMSPQFQFDDFCESAFNVCDNSFGDGRLAVYRDLGWRWPYKGARQPLAGAQGTPGDQDPPMAGVDVPAHLQVVNGRTLFFGWAIDRDSAVVSVSFGLIDAQGVGRSICLEEYNYGGARPDVCSFFGLAKCSHCPASNASCPSGWAGWFDPAHLGVAAGSYVLRVTAKDVDGKTTTYDRPFVLDQP